ncbi:MAG: J domain-containing protein, partial [Proteobacteria bacterium]|nr:J domain-containing protein [Pseudomonadota bacterium]
AARCFVASLDDAQCALYLAPRLVPSFRAFVPSLLDSSLDLDLEAQAFIEFLYASLSDLTPHDLLGMSGNHADKMTVQQAYLRRTKLLHPDRYFRKNVGPFSTHIATLFKAVTRAFNTLQQT